MNPGEALNRREMLEEVVEIVTEADGIDPRRRAALVQDIRGLDQPAGKAEALDGIEAIPDYDAGMLGDGGGGDVGWWHTYIRILLAQANSHWREHLDAITEPESEEPYKEMGE